MKRYHRWQKLIAGAALAAGTCWSTQADEGFARYEVILSRMPFGEEPQVEVDSTPPPAAGPSFADNLRICSITQPNGESIKVGIVDSKTMKSFVLSLGDEDFDGITLVSANLEEEEAILQKGVEIATVRLTDGGAKPQARRSLVSKDQPKPATYAERRQLRRDDRLAKLAEAKEKAQREREPPRFQGEELRQHLQQYNMEVIRQGLPALPIELTPDQDSQLVAEGVLEPPPGSTPTPPAPALFAPAPVPAAAPSFEESMGERVAAPTPGFGDLPVDQMTDEDLILLEQLMNADP